MRRCEAPSETCVHISNAARADDATATAVAEADDAGCLAVGMCLSVLEGAMATAADARAPTKHAGPMPQCPSFAAAVAAHAPAPALSPGRHTAGEAPARELQERYLRCDLCDFEASGPKDLCQHLSGRRHRDRVDALLSRAVGFIKACGGPLVVGKPELKSFLLAESGCPSMKQVREDAERPVILRGAMLLCLVA